MKHIFHHPNTPSTGKKYWKSVEEYSDTPEFHSWLHREFPQGAAEFNDDGLSRRSFVRLMGASLALAGVGLSGCRRPEAHILPYTKLPEWMVPGRYLHYCTAMPRRRGAAPLLITTYDGRPTKIEGNPVHPQSRGKTDVYSQASVLDLYDPDRLRNFVQNTSGGHKNISRDEFFNTVDTLRNDWAKDGGASLAVLADETLSPTRERLKAELEKQFPKMTWAVYEPLASEEEDEALRLAFGEGVRAVPQIDQAKVIVSIDSDLLGTEEGTLKTVRDFADGRRVEKPGDPMNRLYAVEHHYTTTGAMADHRLRIPASQMGTFLQALAKECISFGATGDLASMVGSPNVSLLPGKQMGESIREMARDLVENAGRSVVLVGIHQPVSVQVLGFALNQALKNIGTTLVLKKALAAKAQSIQSLASAIQQGSISSLIILGGNPAYNAPAELKWADLQKKVAHVIHHTLSYNETSALSHLVAPSAHYLESWGDTLSTDGSTLAIQPMILPLFGGISQLQLLAKAAGQQPSEGPELVRETFNQKNGTGDAAWEKFLHDGSTMEADGVISHRFNVGQAAAYVQSNPIQASKPSLQNIEVVFKADPSIDDGRFNNNGWLQEWPDPITRLTWENAALISPTTARELNLQSPSIDGVVTGDVISIRMGDRELKVPVMVVPGHADYSVTLPLGYGREVTGRVGEGSGFNAYKLRTSQGNYVVLGSVLKKIGETHKFAVTQDHFSMEGRAIVQEAPLEHFNQNPEFVKTVGVEAHAPQNRSLYDNSKFQEPNQFSLTNKPPLTAIHQWAMSIDLTTCVGCNACVVACQSENNIPIVGKEQVMKGREMHWIRIDRYFASSYEFNQDKGELPSDPEVLVQPVTCMQCENAPCETVCPVNATVHSEDGLNAMAYNRCIGTRYCANNCPYKVRRFNFFDFNQRPISNAKLETVGPINVGPLYQGPLQKKGMEETLKLQKNPNVTVRMRGVMEKCTFCVQRLEAAKIDQKVKAGGSPNVMIPTDSVQTACQQACPADAIVFGNLTDPKSRVVKLRALPQRYDLLGYLNTQPRLTYLARLRNPNMRMPGAEKVGNYLLSHAHGGHHESHGHSEGTSSHGGTE